MEELFELLTTEEQRRITEVVQLMLDKTEYVPLKVNNQYFHVGCKVIDVLNIILESYFKQQKIFSYRGFLFYLENEVYIRE